MKKTKQKVHDLGLEEYVRFLGVRDDVNELYNIMDLFLLPSFYEGLPVVGVESQVNGLRSLVSDNITSEMNVSNLVEYKSLCDGVNAWARKILEHIDQTYARIDTYKIMTAHNFNIELESAKLEAWYLGEYYGNKV